MTLSETALMTKKAFRLGIVGIIGLIILWILFNVLYNTVYLPRKLAEQQKPDMKFGVLPKPNFSQNVANSADFTYTIDTQSGVLPTDFPTGMPVYFIPQLGTTLLAPDRAKTLTKNLGFTIGPDILGPSSYRFTDGRGGELNMDLNTSNFNFKRAVLNTTGTQQLIPDEEKITSDFKSFLNSKTLLPEGLSEGRVKVTYDKPNRSEASTAAVSIWQNDIEGYPIVTAKFNEALIKGTVTKYQQEADKYTELSYVYWPIDQNTYSVYPLKSSLEAFEELKNGQGIVITQPSNRQASITEVYLGYFLEDNYAPYIQPVFVFQGDSFVGYVPAIVSSSLAN